MYKKAAEPAAAAADVIVGVQIYPFIHLLLPLMMMMMMSH